MPLMKLGMYLFIDMLPNNIIGFIPKGFFSFSIEKDQFHIFVNQGWSPRLAQQL